MNGQDYSTGWCCDDCLFLLANGDTPERMHEQETEGWLRCIDRLTSDVEHVTLGLMWGGEGCDCSDEQIAASDYDAHDYCERREFSWSRCDHCGNKAGGSRHAVTFWFPREGRG